MRVLARSAQRRFFNCGLYQNWCLGRWYPVEVLPRLEVSWNQAVGAVHVTAAWLAFEFNLNVFLRRRR